MVTKHDDVKTRHKHSKKRPATDKDPFQAGDDAIPAENLENNSIFDMSEPTIGEKVEKLRLSEPSGEDVPAREPSADMKLPTVSSVHILLKQALNAEDHVLLLKCLNNRESKVISNSVAQLSPADVIRLLNSLVPITQSRGSSLVCAVPWLRSLLIHHASSIMAHESALSILNSLYQVIESRTSTLALALQLSTSIDSLFKGMVDDGFEEDSAPPVIFEDRDTDEEEDLGEAMESDEENGISLIDGVDMPDSDGSDVMSQ